MSASNESPNRQGEEMAESISGSLSETLSEPQSGLIPETLSANRFVRMHILPDDYTVCQISDPSDIPFADEFVFVGKTDEELSLVCRTESVPLHTSAREDGWKAIKILGVLDFSLVGILAGIASILAEQHISIFAVSTFNTDYILLKSENLLAAETALKGNGYTFI